MLLVIKTILGGLILMSVGAFIIWGFWNEELMCEFEHETWLKIKHVCKKYFKKKEG